MASGIYINFKVNVMGASFNLATDTIKCALMNISYAFTAAHTTWSQESANEISGTGYTPGGAALTGLSLSPSGTTGVWTASNVAWTGATFNTYGAILNDTTANLLIAALDFGGELSVTGGTFTIEWSGSGIISLA